MQNPESAHLRIVDSSASLKRGGDDYGVVLGLLAVAEAFLSKGSQTAQEHFIAVVKEIEDRYGFKFEKIVKGSSIGKVLFCHGCCKEVSHKECDFKVTYTQHVRRRDLLITEVCGYVDYQDKPRV
jgi:hypothetical protein